MVSRYLARSLQLSDDLLGPLGSLKMRVLVAIGGLLAASNLAWAADLPVAPTPMAPAVYAPAPPPFYNWSGVYIRQRRLRMGL
jgi:hypothetical protein